MFIAYLITKFFTVDCTQDSHCSNGQTCDNNVCTCSQDSECASTQACQNGKCQEATCNNISCGANAACEVSNNDATCQCNSGYHVVTTPEDGCGKNLYLVITFLTSVRYISLTVDCTEDSHCANGQTCSSNVCTCSQNSNCESTQSCLSGKCEVVTCDNTSCGTNAQCTISNNAASCECESGYHAIISPDAGCGKTSESCHYVSQLNPT